MDISTNYRPDFLYPVSDKILINIKHNCYLVYIPWQRFFKYCVFYCTKLGSRQVPVDFYSNLVKITIIPQPNKVMIIIKMSRAVMP